MPKIDPARLKALRSKRGWSQEELAEKTKISGHPKIDKQTISRLERGVAGKTRGRTIHQLARALGVDGDVLAGETPMPEVDRESEPLAPKSQFNVRVSRAARNALGLVAQRYRVDPWQIVELAPFLFYWAAEASLRARREDIDEFETARENLTSLSFSMPHVPAPNAEPVEDKMIAAERSSIDLYDIFGEFIFVVDDLIADPGAEDPFSAFLRNLVKDFGDDAEFEHWDQNDGPKYHVCFEDAVAFVGGDRQLAEAIVRGYAALHEMPKEIVSFEKTKEHAAWVQANAEQYLKELEETSKELKETNKKLKESLSASNSEAST